MLDDGCITGVQNCHEEAVRATASVHIGGPGKTRIVLTTPKQSCRASERYSRPRRGNSGFVCTEILACQNDVIETVELGERLVCRDELVATGYRKCSQIGIHPELWRRTVPRCELLPVVFDPLRFSMLEFDPVIGEKRLIVVPCLPVGERLTSIWSEHRSAGQEPEERLLRCPAKTKSPGCGDATEPMLCGEVEGVMRDCQRNPHVTIAKDHCAPRFLAPEEFLPRALGSGLHLVKPHEEHAPAVT